jgi:hypothetical protein
MSSYDVMYVEYDQGYYALPERIGNLDSVQPYYASLTEADLSRTVSSFGVSLQRIYDSKTGLELCLLVFPKDLAAIDQTEGILRDLTHQYEEQGIDPVDLVKRAWKTSEENGNESP